MAILEAITAGKALVEVSKIILDLVNHSKLDADAIRQRVSEMLIHLTSMQTALVELQNENRELQEQLQHERSRQDLDEDMDYQVDGSFFIRKSESSKGKVVAYCPVCWRKDSTVMPMKNDSVGWFTCPLHKDVYQTQAGREYERRLNEQSQSYSGPDSWMGD